MAYYKSLSFTLEEIIEAVTPKLNKADGISKYTYSIVRPGMGITDKKYYFRAKLQIQYF